MISPDEAGSLQQTLRELLAYKDMDLVRKKELGEKNCLEGIHERAKTVFAPFSRIDESKLERLTNPIHAQLQRAINEFLMFFSDAIEYDPAKGSTKQDLFFRLDRLVLEHSPQTKLIIDYLYPIEDQANKILESIKTTEEDCKRLLRILQNAAAKDGVGENATYFVNAAESHRKAASRWLWTILCLGISLVAFALFAPLISQVLWFRCVDDIQLGITKFIIFTAIASGTAVANRNYSAHRHNDIVNSHREKALLTFERLAEASPDEQTRRVILTHASACIFSPQPTGLVKEGGPLHLPLATEMLRKATD